VFALILAVITSGGGWLAGAGACEPGEISARADRTMAVTRRHSRTPRTASNAEGDVACRVARRDNRSRARAVSRVAFPLMGEQN
jgi:hypothetical protein